MKTEKLKAYPQSIKEATHPESRNSVNLRSIERLISAESGTHGC
jgi:hypothetical protein